MKDKTTKMSEAHFRDGEVIMRKIEGELHILVGEGEENKVYFSIPEFEMMLAVAKKIEPMIESDTEE